MGNPFDSSGNVNKPDGVTVDAANEHDLQSHIDASQQLSQLFSPVFIHKSNPHERIFFAAFDGTGNDMSKDEKTGHMTNVALITRQIQKAFPNTSDHIQVGYVEGPGTQNNVIARTIDGVRGYTHEPRVERMYAQFIAQSEKWINENPEAQIRVVSTGFSRGGEQAASFARLVHERGIQDPVGAVRGRDVNGNRNIQYTNPALVAPGDVTQAVGLFDPVGTGKPRDFDRRLPPSVISGFQITAEDERRDLFKSTNIIDPGFSENNHFLNVMVGGAHSNIGGSYALNGLAIRSHNLMTDYFNSFSDTPFLLKQAVPTDPAMNVVHRSEEHQFFYRTKDTERNNGRVLLEEVAPRSLGRNGVDINNKELRDEAAAQRHEERKVPIAPDTYTPVKATEPQSKLEPTQAAHPDYRLHQQSSDAVRKLDESMGRNTDVNSDRMAASLTVLAKQSGFQRIDNVVLSRGTDSVKPGENVIIVQGPLDDPSHVRAHMKTQMAIDTPLAESYKKLEAGNVGHENRQQTPNIIRESFQDQEQDLRRQVIAR